MSREIAQDRTDWWLRQIERLFQKFEDFYGTKWAAQYGDFPRERVKSTWAEELAGFIDKPEVIARAVSSQRENKSPPTLPEFMTNCRNEARRIQSAPALPSAHSDPNTVRTRTASISISMRDQYVASLAWAEKLRDKYLAGERLLPVQISLASEALGEVWNMGKIEIRQRDREAA